MGLADKILSNKAFIDDDVLGRQTGPQEFVGAGVIIFNLANSGTIDGAFPVGKISVYAADSMLGKSILGMAGIRDAQRKGMFPVVIDAEYQWNWDLAAKIGIDCAEDKILVYQNNYIEQVQSKIVSLTDGLTKKERNNIFLMLDSWGALVTSESVTKAKDPNAKKDMTVVLKKNNLANMLLNTQATCYVINAVYDNVGGFGDPLKIPGGKRLILNASNVVLGRSRSKEKMTIQHEDVLTGSIVSCKVFKSRFSREHEEFRFRIKYNGGVDIFYGILDYAVEGGYVDKSKTGYYTRNCIKDDKKKREREIYNSAFWLPIFEKTDFKKYLESKWTFQGAFDVSSDENFYNEVAGAAVIASEAEVTSEVASEAEEGQQ